MSDIRIHIPLRWTSLLLTQVVLLIAINNPFAECTVQRIVFFNHTELSYCDAHEFCFNQSTPDKDVGFIAGKDLGEYLKTNVVQSISWINIHALLCQESEDINTCWRYGDTGELRSLEDRIRCPVIKGDVSMGDRRLTIINTEKKILQHKTMSIRHPVFCQISDLPENRGNIRVEIFRHSGKPIQANWLAKSSWSVGCFLSKSSTTVLSCAMKYVNRQSVCSRCSVHWLGFRH